MVVVRPVRDDEVGLPLADESGDRPAVFERGEKLAVVDVEDLGLDPEDLGAAPDFRGPSLGEGAAGHFMMADVAVGRADELDLVAELRPAGGRASGGELGVVRMGAEDHDAEGAIGVVLRGGHRGGCRDEKGREGKGEGGSGCHGEGPPWGTRK